MRTYISVELLLVKGLKLRLREEITVCVSGGVIQVPIGFISDLASVPRVFWRILPPWDGQYAEAAVVHDYLWKKGFPKSYANFVFKELMTRRGVAFWKRWLMWGAVTLNGWWCAVRTKICQL